MTADRTAHLLAVQTVQIAVVVSATLVVTTTLLRRRPHLAYAVWLAAVAKCLVPPVWSSPTGVFSWAAADRRTPAVVAPVPASGATNDRQRATPMAARAATPVSAADVARPEPGPVPWAAVVVGTWLAGAGTVLAVTAVASCRLRRRVRRSAVAVPDEVSGAVADVRRSLGLRRRVRVVTTDADVGPALLGTLFPTVVLPRRLAAGDVRTVLGHELAHVRRGDAVVAAGQRLAVALGWFHPLVWLASGRLTAAREQCCDEETVAGLGLDPAAYAQTLLDVARRCRRSRTLALYPGVHSVQLTARRLRHLLDTRTRFRRRPPAYGWATAAALALVVGPGAGLAFRAVRAEEPGPPATRPADRAATVGGRIVDRVTRRPVAGAVVTIGFRRQTIGQAEPLADPVRVTADADGRYAVTVPAAAAADRDLWLSIDARHPAHVPTRGGTTYYPRRRDGRFATDLTVEMYPGTPVTGTLVDENGRPLVDVPVRAVWYTPVEVNSTKDTEDAVRTDAGGRFEFVAPTGGRAGEFYAYPPTAATTHVDVGDRRGDLGQVVAYPGTPVTGTVVDRDGRPVSGLAVVARSRSHVGVGAVDLPMAGATTDAAGGFSVGPLPSGAYLLTVADEPAFGDQWGRLTTPPPGLYEPMATTVGGGRAAAAAIEFRPLDEVRVRVRCMTAAGGPSADALRIGADLRGPAGVLQVVDALARPDAQGRIDVAVPKTSDVSIDLDGLLIHNTVAVFRDPETGRRLPDRSLSFAHVTEDVGGIEVVRMAEPVLTVKVVAADGTAVPAGLPTISYDEPKLRQTGVTWNGGMAGDVGLNRSSGGAWKAERLLPDQPFQLAVAADGYAAATQARLTLTAGEKRTVTVRLTAAATTRPAIP